jgi:hypothetical protein
MTDSERKRRVRGWVLQILALEPVQNSGKRVQVSMERLHKLVIDTGCLVSIEHVQEQISYLKGKGYVEVEQFTGIAAKMAGGVGYGVRVTPTGQDLVDHTTTDIGVDLGAL